MDTKRYIRILAAAAVAIFSAVATTGVSAREVYNLNARWIFFTGTDTHTDNAAVVDLPHTWNGTAAAGGAYWRGDGNYLKEIEIPVEWAGRRIFLRIGGAATTTDIFVNSRHAATHNGAAAGFTVEVTGLLRPGQSNSLRIAVNNSPRLDVLPTAGEENLYGGLYRGAELIVCDPLSISPATPGGDGIRITTESLSGEKVEGTVHLSLLDMPRTPEGALVRVRFLDAEERLVAQNSMPVDRNAVTGADGGTCTVTLPFTLSTPRLWQGVEDPYLYNVEVTLTDASGTTTDSLALRTGFRTVGIDSRNNFLLNGKPLKLRGVVIHRDRMVAGTAVAPFQIEEDVNLIREMGANAVRIAGGRHADYFYTLCDEAGLIVWNDGPFTGAAYPTEIDFVDTPAFRENGEQQLCEMISQLCNHPCIAMWGIFSDVSMRGDNPLSYIRRLNDLARSLDPSRLTAGSSVQDGDINFVTDLVSFNLSFGWTSGMPDSVIPWLEQIRRNWSGLRAGFSYSAGASIFRQSERLEKPSPQSNHHPEGWQTFLHEEYVKYGVDAPGVWGVFVGNMFDFGAARHTWGDGNGINDHGLVTFDRKDRKDAYYIYKANWNDSSPFVYIAGKRLDVRTSRRQQIRVYSNAPEAELFVGGRSQGKRTASKGIFTWEVELRGGINRLEARAGGASDRASVNIDASAPSPGRNRAATQTSATVPPPVPVPSSPL